MKGYAERSQSFLIPKEWRSDFILGLIKMITQIQLQNLGTANKNRVIINTNKSNFILYFSYETLVGINYFLYDKNGNNEQQKRFVIENQWSTTTGKMLNEIEPDKKKRIKPEQFDKEVEKMIKFINS